MVFTTYAEMFDIVYGMDVDWGKFPRLKALSDKVKAHPRIQPLWDAKKLTNLPDGSLYRDACKP